VPAEEPAPSAPGAEFVLGFAQLKARMGPVMGDPVESEHGNADNCDTQQLTSTGLAYWRCSTNVVSFAAFPDGAVHWALSSAVEFGLVEWTGPDADPPSGAATIAAVDAAAEDASGGAADDPPFTTQCLAAGSFPTLPCASGDSPFALATIQNPGDTVTFEVNVPQSGERVAAELVDLPADYDLYLVDGSGAIVGESVQEGTTPEQLEFDLPGGMYYLYVYADPGRLVDAQRAFRVEVSVT